MPKRCERKSDAVSDASIGLRLKWATAKRDRIAEKAPETISSAYQYRRLCWQVVRLRYLLEMEG